MSKFRPIREREKLSSENVHENELLNRVFQNRAITSSDELEYGIAKILHHSTLRGTDKAAPIIANAIIKEQRIIIVGDYDCDGATSTAIMVRGLTLLGAKDVRYTVPHREKHGYGLSPPVVDMIAEQKPDLIITVDNGVASFAGVDAVKALEHPCKIVVTDHHLMPEAGEPDADTIINPQHPECEFKSKNIAGCGVAFYTMVALRAWMRENKTFETIGINEPSLAPLLDFLALGTVADVVPLDYNNRTLIQEGINRIQAGRANPGIQALLQVAGRDPSKVKASDFGFGLGPRLNAAGRLEDMTIGIKCLLEEDFNQALEMAKYLDSLNGQRKEIEGDMLQLAISTIEKEKLTEKKGVCLYGKSWHEGVIGILASRIKDRLFRPVICFTNTHELTDAAKRYSKAKTDEERQLIQEEAMALDIKGSARSVKDIHLKHILDRINKLHPEILSKFGGHAMAAGLSVKRGHLDKFQEIFNEYVSEELSDSDMTGEIEVDIKDLSGKFVNIEIAKLIESNGPWGQKFEEPSFSSRFIVKEIRKLKNKITGEDKHLKMKLQPCDSDDSHVVDAIYFNCIENGAAPAAVGNTVEVVYKLDINEWRGEQSVQLMVEHLQDEDLLILDETREATAIANDTSSTVTLPGLSAKR